MRLEFFGDELESLRHFDPLTQMSHEKIENVTLPPAGELGVLKRLIQEEVQSPKPQAQDVTTPAEQAQSPTSKLKTEVLRTRTPACVPADRPEIRQPRRRDACATQCVCHCSGRHVRAPVHFGRRF